MILFKNSKTIFVFCIITIIIQNTFAQRMMENLGRGVVAVRVTNTQAFISWRILGTEANTITFNIYRTTGTGSPVKLNATPITGGTNWQDNTVDFTKENAYSVSAIINGVEKGASAKSIIKANTTVSAYPMLTIPLKNVSSNAADYDVHFAWVGDLDGDGEYDFVVDRIPLIANQAGKVEAYKSNGTFLWRIDMGPLGIDRNNIEGGATAISNGHWDGLTVYDLDNDGKAEVIIKAAKDVVFGNGSKMSANNTTDQFVAVCDGMTGKLRASIKMPTDYASDGPLQAHFGIAYLDGINPSIIVKAKNRIGSDGFNLVMTSYDFKNNALTERWKYKRGNAGADFHQIRTIDVDGDGKDDICDGAYVVDENGKMLYNIKEATHGDRFHISDMDPDRPGLEGFAIQQENPSTLATYYYDAKTGAMLRKYSTPTPQDMARGTIADIDAPHRGYEYWSFNGVYTAQSTTKIIQDADVPWPNFRIWWDGDVLSELLNETKVDKYGGGRLLTAYKNGAVEEARAAPAFYGDIIGDWREEVIFESSDHTQLQIFTSPIPSSTRIYTLAHNPAYRNCFTYKGYMQSNQVDYYLGDGMVTPPKPNIKLVNSNIDNTVKESIPVVAKKYIYNYDNSGNYSWTNTNSWTPKAVPTAIDTVIIRTGEVQIDALTHTAPVYVETNGILRLVTANSTINKIYMQGGTLKVFTSSPELALSSDITVEKPSTIMAGSVAATVFTLNGTITGSSNLTKTSVGILRINSTATGFKGNWIINEGKIQLRSASGLGVCGVQVKTGARLDIEAAGASIYSLVVDSGGGVDLDQNLNTNVAVFGTENILAGAHKNANYPSYIGSTAALNVSNSLVVLNGPAALCTGSSLTATASSGASYIWKNNTTQVGTAAAYTTSAAGSYTVDATNAAGCKVSSAPVITTIVALPAATITSPATSFCTGGSVVLSANTGTGLTYQWSNAAGTISGATAATYTAAAAGGYSVKVTNTSGCKATSAVTQITVSTLPTATITSPATSFCTGGSVLLTSSTGSSYKWFNGTTQVGTASTYSATNAGSYTVEVTNASDCKATSAVTQITVSTLPTATITSSSTSFCTGGSVLLTASTGSSYKWFNGTTQVGTAASYTATADGAYTVEVTNASGCKATSALTQITGSIQLTPTITSSSTSFCTGGSVILTASTGSSYKWFNGTTQVGTAATYNATVAGSYTVEVTNASGCKTTSAVTQITVSSGTVWYADTDKDGKGDPAVSQTACTQPTGYVSVAGDACPLDVNKTTPGACGCGKIETDTDGDGTPDCIDADDDNDGVADANDCQPLNVAVTGTTNWYSDADGDGKGDPSSSLFACTQPTGYVSTAGDTCPLDANKTTPGDCGCGKVETDTDSDGSADCIDNDDDNDGVADANDCQPLNVAVTSAANWYRDTDGDGKGDPSSSLFACTQPAGYVSTADDTCPSDPDKSAPGNCGCDNKEASCLDCAGTPNGTAVIDNCNICTGGTTGKTACLTTATVNGTTANITVTPQPFDNTTTIKLENNGNIQSVTIISAAGALVDYKSEINNTEIIVGEELIAGLYTVIIQTDKGVHTTKIVKK